MVTIKESVQIIAFANKLALIWHFSVICILQLSVALVFLIPIISPCAAAQSASNPSFAEMIKRLAAPDADNCNEKPNGSHPDIQWLRHTLFWMVGDEVTAAANAKPNDSDAAEKQLAALKKQADSLVKSSDVDEDFNYTVTHIGNAILIALSYRQGADFFLLAKPEGGNTHAPWHHYIGFNPTPLFASGQSVKLMPLIGPSGTIRFLATTYWWGCMGNTEGVSYDAYEWHFSNTEALSQIIHLEGVSNLEGDADDDDQPTGQRDETVEQFLKADEPLQTPDGHLILQYCSNSPVDTWDHATLCGVDIYDLSGSTAYFIETRPARPDIQALATAIEYASKHDARALRGYVSTPELADRLIHEDLPNAIGDFILKSNQDGSESVIMGAGAADQPDVKYTLVKRKGIWIVSDYQPGKSDSEYNRSDAKPKYGLLKRMENWFSKL